jgi:tetraacyldisaccharide 4'-kinase
MFKKFPNLTVAVDGNRRRGITNLLALENPPEIILLDDAFQHRYVKPSFSILLTDYGRLLYNDHLLPWGRLREARGNRRRADIVIVTKCTDELKPIDLRIIESKMKLASHQRIYFTKMGYDKPRPLFPEIASPNAAPEIAAEAIAIAGIAYPGSFLRKSGTMFQKLRTFTFNDHYMFTQRDFQDIQSSFDALNHDSRCIITTEKDAARLIEHPDLPEEWKQYIYVLPVCIEFCTDGQADFDERIRNHIVMLRRSTVFS